jgi:hypothetical protein
LNFLGWVDHDGEHEQSILRALGAAKGHDARDELSLGTIRDSFADLLFPGLSTIQERVRYFLFVQWCCEIAARQGHAERIVDELRKAEVALIKTLSQLARRGRRRHRHPEPGGSGADAKRGLLERPFRTRHAADARRPTALGPPDQRGEGDRPKGGTERGRRWRRT